MSKVYTVRVTTLRSGSKIELTGTVEELIKKCEYTLEKGHSWQHEKGNKKINKNPRGIKSLISNLNNSVGNAAANGMANTYYSLVGGE